MVRLRRIELIVRCCFAFARSSDGVHTSVRVPRPTASSFTSLRYAPHRCRLGAGTELAAVTG
jgi:hypothetical protein